MRIVVPETFGPDAETRVPCPCCHKGMVSPGRAVKVREALKDEPKEVTSLSTDILPIVPPREP